MNYYFTDKSGGAKINDRGFSSNSDSPAWATRWDQECWNKRGVVIWQDALYRLEWIWASRALDILQAARSEDSWRTDGIPITSRATRLPLSESSSSRRGRKKGPELPEDADSANHQAEPTEVIEERFRLSGGASVELIDFLAAHESELREMAEADERDASRVLGQVYERLAEIGRGVMLSKLNLSSRPVSWRLDSQSKALICDLAPNRGTVRAYQSWFGWRGCIESPDCFPEASPVFNKVEEALAWVEREIVKPASKPENDDELRPFELTPDLLKRLQPFWITPESLEPKQLTYRAIIELEYSPITFKTGEISFGKKYQYAKEYLDATALGRALNLSPERLDIKHLRHTGFYTIKSLVAYRDGQLASLQAQQLWEQSTVQEHYKLGKVLRARYGLQEAETSYVEVVGVCCAAEDSWAAIQTRDDYMAAKALECTLAHALDLNAYRAYFGLKHRWVTDDDLLYKMHRRRAKCPAVPTEARQVSEDWLLQHPD